MKASAVQQTPGSKHYGLIASFGMYLTPALNVNLILTLMNCMALKKDLFFALTQHDIHVFSFFSPLCGRGDGAGDLQCKCDSIWLICSIENHNYLKSGLCLSQ